MRESLDQWLYVSAAYGVVLFTTLAMVGWSLLSMRNAEKKRDKARGK